MILFNIIVLLFAIVIHECAHGWVADKLGDPTARYAGRLTLNPLSHIDLFGTIIIPLILILSRSPVLFGYAKPVPVNPYNFKDPKRDMIWVSLAGPGANILTAALCGIVFRGVNLLGFRILAQLAAYAVFINLILAVFNLIPIPPLDGSKVLMGLLPPEQEYRFHELERWGFFILIGIFMLEPYIHLFSAVIFPFVNFMGRVFTGYKFF